MKEFFVNIWLKIDDVLKGLKLDEHILRLYDTYVSPLHELFKWLLVILLLIIVVLGSITFAKKMIKLFLVIAIIAAIIIFLSKK